MLALLHLAPEGLTLMSPTARTSKMQSGTSKMQSSRIRMDTEATRDGDVDVTSWVPASLGKVVDTLGLTEKEYAAELGYDSFSLAGSTGSVRSYEGSGSPNVAWCSGLALDGARASISAFCGPLTDVPHLIASAGVSDGGIDLYIDWRPRADAAYDPACAAARIQPAPPSTAPLARTSEPFAPPPHPNQVPDARRLPGAERPQHVRTRLGAQGLRLVLLHRGRGGVAQCTARTRHNPKPQPQPQPQP